MPKKHNEKYSNLAAQVRKLKHNFELLEAGLSRDNTGREDELERTRPRTEMRPSSTSAALFSALNLDPGEQFWLAAASTAMSNRATALQPLEQVPGGQARSSKAVNRQAASVNAHPKSEAKWVVEEERAVRLLTLTTRKALGFYMTKAKEFLEPPPGHTKVELRVSSLGNASSMAAEITAQMERDGLAVVTMVKTQYCSVGSGDHSCAGLVVTLTST